MKVAIRADASLAIGTGHVMRCLTLAEALRKRGVSVLFLCRALEGNLSGLIRERGFELGELPARSEAPDDTGPTHYAWLGTGWRQDIADCGVVLAAGAPPDWLIVDHYALDARWERSMRRWAPRLMVIDDLADRDHDCDLLFDQNIHEETGRRYEGRVPGAAKQMLGGRFALLREEFDRARRLHPRAAQSPLRRLLILFGGIDRDNDTLEAIRAVERLQAPQLRVDVIVAPRNMHAAVIRDHCATRPWITLHSAPSELAELMARADLAIGAGGTTTFERLHLGLPALLKPVSLNQAEPLETMSRMGLFELYRGEDELLDRLRQKQASGVTAPPDVVANGTHAVVRQLLCEQVELRSPVALDLRRSFAWLQDARLRADFMVKEAPRRRTHFTYWRRLMEDPAQLVFSIRAGGRHLGNCGLKNIEVASGRAELWIYLGDPEARGRGVGRAAVIRLLGLFRSRMAGRSVYLHLRRDNQAARALYLATGFAESKDPLEGPWKGAEAEMLRMEVQL